MCERTFFALGWHPDIPDYRDYDPETPLVAEMLGRLRSSRSPGKRREQKVDLREFFPPAHDQQDLRSSTMHACIDLFEYGMLRAFGKSLEPSRLFLHFTTRALSGGAAGGLRTCLGAMKQFGVPPETLWRYDTAKVGVEPPAFLFSFGDEYNSIHYVRLDARNSLGSDTLRTVKAFLSAGFPLAFGMPVASSVMSAANIPYRPTFDSIRGGQAVVAVGYDDRHLNGTRGALLIRNSWGRSWGDEGYGWLPYAYVEQRLAIDFWALLRADWLATGEFKRPMLESMKPAKRKPRKTKPVPPPP